MAGEEPAAKRAKMQEGANVTWKFMSAWFCPYAQRAWIALNHHRVPYEKIEALTLKLAPGETLKDAKGYEKHPLLLKHHPGGLVPTIVDSLEQQPAVYDSLICVQFADELASAKAEPGAALLLPRDPVERARARMWADWVDKNVSSPFYSVLVPKDPERRKSGFEKLREGLLKFQSNLSGPFFLGKNLSIVDIAAIPWAFRIFTCSAFERYRGPELTLNRQEFGPLLKWLDACLALESVSETLPDKEKLIDTYQRYADGTAESKVADAVRAGKNANDHD